MIDQWWDFAYTAGDAIKQAGLDEQGCDYIPVPVTIDGRDNQWHNAGALSTRQQVLLLQHPVMM